jgi:hypothetical protein
MNDGDDTYGKGHGHDHERDDEVAAHRFDWALREVVGSERAPDVLAAVQARYAAGETGEAAGESATPATSRGRWLAFAAVFLLGVLTVLGVAFLQGDPGASESADETQQPAETKLREVTARKSIATLPVDLRAVELRNLDDAAVTELVARCPDLEHLRIFASTSIGTRPGDRPAVSITDAAFPAIGSLSRLRRLELCGVLSVQGKNLRELERLPLLERLQCAYFDLDDDSVQVLPRLPSLRDLDLAGNQGFREAGFAAIGQCVGLRKLSLAGSSRAIADDWFKPLARLMQLETLNLHAVGITRRLLFPHGFPEPPRPRFGERGIGQGAIQLWPRLHTLSLRNCIHLPNTVGARLRQCCPVLRELDLGICIEIDDTTIADLIAIGSLRTLRVDDCPNVTATSLPLLAAADQLRSIEFGKAEWLTLPDAERLMDRGKLVQATGGRMEKRLALLAAMRRDLGPGQPEIVRTVEQLADLMPHRTRIECRGLGDSAVPLLEKRENLLALELVGDEIGDRLTGAGLARICRLPKLEALNLTNLTHLCGSDLRPIADMQRLRSLSFTGIAVDDNVLFQLPRVVFLSELDLTGTRSFSTEGMRQICGCGKLQKLSVARCTQLDADAFTRLGMLTELRDLDLSGLMLNDRAVANLGECKAMRRLNLAGGAFTGDALQVLAEMGKLEALDVGDNRELGAMCLLHVPANVKELRLDKCPGLGEDAARLLCDRFQNLRVLHVGGNDWVTDQVLRLLTSMPSLQRLDLSSCQKLTNASFATILAAKSLRSIATSGTACLTKEQAIALQRERPDLELTSFVW